MDKLLLLLDVRDLIDLKIDPTTNELQDKLNPQLETFLKSLQETFEAKKIDLNLLQIGFAINSTIRNYKQITLEEKDGTLQTFFINSFLEWFCKKYLNNFPNAKSWYVNYNDSISSLEAVQSKILRLMRHHIESCIFVTTNPTTQELLIGEGIGLSDLSLEGLLLQQINRLPTLDDSGLGASIVYNEANEDSLMVTSNPSVRFSKLSTQHVIPDKKTPLYTFDFFRIDRRKGFNHYETEDALRSACQIACKECAF